AETTLAPDRLRQALGQLWEHHDALRSRFAPGPVIDPPGAPGAAPRSLLVQIDLSALPAARQAAALEASADALQASFDPARGPLLRAALYAARLLLVLHHLVVDGVSWRILAEDLETAYRGEALPPRTSSLRTWAERQVEAARTAEVGWWLERLAGGVAPLP